MAEKRMTGKDVVETDFFYGLNLGSQALWLHGQLCSDDEGFCASMNGTAKRLGLGDSGIEELVSLGYVLKMSDNVYVFKHWFQQNSIAPDRFRQTEFSDFEPLLYVKDDGSYTLSKEKGIWLPDYLKERYKDRYHSYHTNPVNESREHNPSPQISIGKCSKGLDKCSEDTKEGAGDASQIVMDDESDDTAKDFKEMFKGGKKDA